MYVSSEGEARTARWVKEFTELVGPGLTHKGAMKTAQRCFEAGKSARESAAIVRVLWGEGQ